MSTTVTKSKFELVIEAIRVIIWPITLFLMLIIFWSPINLIVNSMPGIVNRSESISIAGLSIKINKELAHPPTDEVREVLQKLTPDEIQNVINNSSRITYTDGGDYGRHEYENLIELGLFREVSIAEQENSLSQNEKPGFAVEPTKLGAECRDFLLELIGAFTKQL